MEDQVAFFNNADQIVFDYMVFNHFNFVNNHMKDIHFDKFNDTKSIVVNYIDCDDIQNNIILIDTITFNKLNIMKFNNY